MLFLCLSRSLAVYSITRRSLAAARPLRIWSRQAAKHALNSPRQKTGPEFFAQKLSMVWLGITGELVTKILQVEKLCLLQPAITLRVTRQNHDLKPVGAFLQEGEHSGETARVSRIKNVVEHDELAFIFSQHRPERESDH